MTYSISWNEKNSLVALALMKYTFFFFHYTQWNTGKSHIQNKDLNILYLYKS